MLPTDQQIKALHRKYAKTDTAFKLIYTHCRIISDIASQLLDDKPELTIDRRLVKAGCLLHDIGAYLVLDKDGRFVQGVKHGVLGEAVLRDEGFSDVICRFASHHTGVGLTGRDVIGQNLPIPVSDYTARTDEERLIMYADKFHSKSNPSDQPPYFCTFEWYRGYVSKHGEDKALKFDALMALFGKPELGPLSKKYGYEIRDIGI